MNDFEEYDEEEVESFESQAWDLARDSKINVLSGKDLADYYIDPDTSRVAGALFTQWADDEFSFDVVVDPDNQGKGIGKDLVDRAISIYDIDAESYAEMGRSPYISVDVVDPRMRRILENKGFEVVDVNPSAQIMRKAQKNLFIGGPVAFVRKQEVPAIDFKEDKKAEALLETLESNNKRDIDDVVKLLEKRFKIRRIPHSFERLERVLKEPQFEEYNIDKLFDKIVEALEKVHRRFEKLNKNRKKRSRNKRKRKR